MIANGPERNADRPRNDPEWLEVAARQENARARAGAIAVIALLTILLAVLYSAMTPAGAANLEYGPETEQVFMDSCMRTAPRADCQCRMEGLQRLIGMEAFYDAVERGDEQTLFHAARSGFHGPGRRCVTIAGAEDPAAPAESIAGEIRVE